MTLAPGTKAVIKPTLHGRHHTDKAFVEKWQDFPVEILRFDPRSHLYKNGTYYCKPLRPRPDLTNDPFYQFYWDVDEVEAAGPLDMLGNAISVGDKVVYPNRHSSSLWMVHAEVVEIGEKPEYSWSSKTRTIPFIKIKAKRRYGNGDYTAHVTHFERVVRL